MAEGIKRAVTRVFTADGQVVGGGFLVTRKHLFTCAHVVAQALEIPAERFHRRLGIVTVDFPLIAPGEKVAARIVHWLTDEDIAVLRLIDDPAEGVRPVALVPSENVWEHPFRAFGFPSGHDKGVWATGRLLDRRANGWLQIEGVSQAGYIVAPGFSGTPIWDSNADGVVGMVVGSDRRAELKSAFIIPTDKLNKAWPELEAVKLAEVSEWVSEPLALPHNVPLPGESVILTCNRAPQSERFYNYFNELNARRPGAPQAYFIHGEWHQRPGSLVVRLKDTCIRQYIAEQRGKADTRLIFRSLEWPDQDDLPARQKRLPFALLRALDPDYRSPETSSAACRRLLAEKYADAVLVIEHNLLRSNWDRRTRRLIKWYLSYWDEVKGGWDIPPCVLFLNIIHPSEPSSGGTASLRLALGRLSKRLFVFRLHKQFNNPDRTSKSHPPACSCAGVVLQELTCVTLDDVMDWFNRIQLRDAALLSQWCKHIFGTDDPRRAPCRNMLHVETKLSELRAAIEERYVAARGIY